MTLEQQLLVGAIGGLAAALVTSALQFMGIKLSLRHAKASDRKTDERRLRDTRFIRLRTALEPALMASLAFGQVVADTQRIYAQESVEERDKRHLKLLEDTEPGLNEARVSLMLEPVASVLMEVLDEKILRHSLGIAAHTPSFRSTRRQKIVPSWRGSGSNCARASCSSEPTR